MCFIVGTIKYFLYTSCNFYIIFLLQISPSLTPNIGIRRCKCLYSRYEKIGQKAAEGLSKQSSFHKSLVSQASRNLRTGPRNHIICMFPWTRRQYGVCLWPRGLWCLQISLRNAYIQLFPHQNIPCLFVFSWNVGLRNLRFN